MKKIAIGFICFTLGIASTAAACRFWVAVSQHIPQDTFVHQLLDEPNSLKILGSTYSDGWSVGYYESGVPMISRGVWPAGVDEHFNRSVMDVAQMEPKIAFGHLRRASSGCKEGVPNPHPFERIEDKKTWIFGHNGSINKDLLIELIGKDFLEENPPQVCTQNPPDTWIDSELYFIFILKNIEENGWDVIPGLQKAIRTLTQRDKDQKQILNFFLSDGEQVWVFRKGETLFYYRDKKSGTSIVSSAPSSPDDKNWEAFPEDTLGVLTPGKEIQFLPLEPKG